MSKVTDIDNERPHYLINTGDKIHVLPESFVNDVINGKRRWTEADDWEPMLIAILSDWQLYQISCAGCGNE